MQGMLDLMTYCWHSLSPARILVPLWCTDLSELSLTPYQMGNREHEQDYS